jgi:Spy/CpxP family protein refolding chaperone
MSVVVAQTPADAATAAVTNKQTRSEAAEGKNRRSEHLQKLSQRLKLTADQTASVKAIMDAQWAQSRELRDKYKGQAWTPENKAAMESARKDLRADTDTKLAQVLTADQMTEFKKMRAEHMKHREWGKGEKDEGKEGKE